MNNLSIYQEKILSLAAENKKSNAIEDYNRSFEVKNPISSENQIWYWKELLTFISLIASFLMIIPIAEILLNIPFFQSLKTTIPEAL